MGLDTTFLVQLEIQEAEAHDGVLASSIPNTPEVMMAGGNGFPYRIGGPER